MKQAQQAVDQMSPEDKKMMDSLGVKMPSFKNVPQVGDKQLAEAWDDETRIVPKKDMERIAAIPAASLNSTSLATYAISTHNKIKGVLTPTVVTQGEQLYAALKSGYTSAQSGNAAVGLWLLGKTDLAVYVMGRVCTADPANDDNISNYASMLTMNGGQQLAIPMLNYLNKKYPGNSTILNNLGQAWFGLGDIDKAEKYLDSTLRIYASHPQATLAKAAIEENKGNKDHAVELIKKSISHAYTQEKEEKLRKDGYKISGDDVKIPPKTKLDYLALEKFSHPDFPKSVGESIVLEGKWQEFRDQLESVANRLKKEYEEAINGATEAQKKRMNTDLAMIRASQAAGSPQGFLTAAPIYSKQAALKIKAFNEGNSGMDYRITRNLKEITDFISGEGAKLENEYKIKIELLNRQESDQTGEGKANRDFCPEKRDAADKFLQAYNGKFEQLVNERLKLLRQQINELAYIHQYTDWEETYRATLIQLKLSWLGALSCKDYNFKSITKYQCAPPPKKDGGKLSDFDDVACQYHSELNFIVAKMNNDCRMSTVEVDAKFIKFKLKQDSDKGEKFNDNFVSCTVEIKGKIGADKATLGPVTVGVKAEAGIGIEVDRTGVKDIYVIGGVGASAGVGGVSQKVGLEGKMSLISGDATINGKGLFKSLR